MITLKTGSVALAVLATLLVAACGDGPKEAEAPDADPKPDLAEVNQGNEVGRDMTAHTGFNTVSGYALPRPRPNVVLVKVDEPKPVTVGMQSNTSTVDPISRLIGVDGQFDTNGAQAVGNGLGIPNLVQQVVEASAGRSAPTHLSPLETVAPVVAKAQTSQPDAIVQVDAVSEVTQLLKPVGTDEAAATEDPIEALVRLGTQELIQTLNKQQ